MNLDLTVEQVRSMIAYYSAKLRSPNFLETIEYHLNPCIIGKHILHILDFLFDQRIKFSIDPPDCVCLLGKDTEFKLGYFEVPNFFT